MPVKLKRDLISLYFSVFFLKSYFKKQYANCLSIASKIEYLQSNISGAVSRCLYGLLKRKYDVQEVKNSNDPTIAGFLQRFAVADQLRFLCSNIIVLKPYLSAKEKGIILLNYTEIVNAFPFLFDIDKIQERYHIVLEPSSESPYQMYYKFYKSTSEVFVQSLSKREIAMDEKHGYVAVPVCAGDWISESKFFSTPEIPAEYDFCAISNFIPVKRHEYLFAALARYWKGDLKFALVASRYVGYDKAWMEGMLKKYNLLDKADIYIEVGPEVVNKVLNQSKCHVLCSLREGANRANFESMYIGTPVVVHKHHMGFPNFRFQYPLVVNYSTSENLVEAIKACAKIDKSVVRTEAQKVIGSEPATKILNESIKQVALAKNNEWTMNILRKVNIVHSYYFDPKDAALCRHDYEFINDAVYDKAYYDLDLAFNRYSDPRS